MKKHLSSGFAALLPVMITSILLLTLSVGATTSSYLVRLSALEAEHAAKARGNAYTCAQIALFELSADRRYIPSEAGDAVFITGENTCLIEKIVREENQYVVTVHGSYAEFTRVLELHLTENTETGSPFAVSFREI